MRQQEAIKNLEAMKQNQARRAKIQGRQVELQSEINRSLPRQGQVPNFPPTIHDK